MRQRQFPGHADAAVQLDAFLGHQRANAADGELGGGQGAFAGDAVGVVQRGGGVDDGRARLFNFQQHIGHAVLQGLEAADGRAELAACAQVFQRGVAGAVHRAHGFGAQRQDAAPGGAFQQRIARAGLAQQGVGPQLDVGQRDFGGAAAVDQPVAAHRQAGRAGADQEQADAGFVVFIPRRARRHQEQVRVFARRDHGLGAVEHPAVARRFGARADPRQLIAGIRFCLCQRGRDGARDQAVHGFALRGRAGGGDGAAHHQGVQKGFHDQAASQRLEDDRDIKARAAQAAIGFREQGADGAQLGVAAPKFHAVALGRLRVAFAGGEVVLLADKAAQHV
ncbi:hypothetical protein D3C85_1005610 [compost metagenome]